MKSELVNNNEFRVVPLFVLKYIVALFLMISRNFGFVSVINVIIPYHKQIFNKLGCISQKLEYNVGSVDNIFYRNFRYEKIYINKNLLVTSLLF
jgi:hypothetical protein